MAVGNAEHPRRRWLDALFGEAFALGRRRHRRQLWVALLICAAAAGGGAGLNFGRGAAASAGGATRLTVSSMSLPPRGSYSSVAAVAGRLVVTGGQPGAALAGGRLTGVCQAAWVDPQSLRVSSTMRGNCGDPALYGRHVLPVSYVAGRHAPLAALALRIAVVDARARDGYRLGPVVLRYPQCSSCRLESLYGDGSLWTYAAYSAPSLAMSARSGTLLRISEQSGRVLQRWRLPSFSRPLLAVDADGAWIAPSLFSGTPAHLPAAELAAYRYLYRVAPRMAAPASAFSLGTGGAYWLVASAHTVWLGLVNPRNDRRPSLLWRLDGPQARAVVRRRPAASGSQCAELGEGPTSTVGDSRVGVFCVALGPRGEHLQSFDFKTGAARTTQVAALRHAPTSIFYAGPQSTTVLGDAAYFLFGAHRLYRVRRG